MPNFLYFLAGLLLFCGPQSHAKPGGKGGVGFVLLNALQREKIETNPSLNFYCSETFEDHINERGGLHHFDVYALKLNPLTRKFEVRTRTDRDQSCIVEKLETIYKRHSCLRESFPPALHHAMKLSRRSQQQYRMSDSSSERLHGYSPELIHYEVVISSPNPNFKFVDPSIWSFLNWNGDSGCEFRFTLRQRLVPNDQSKSWVIDSYLLNSNSF